MLRFEQLDFFSAIVAAPEPVIGRDPNLEETARALLRSVSAHKLVPLVRVEWNPRLRTAAGRVTYQRTLISLNPRLHEHGTAEIDRTLRHELGHLVAQARAGRRRIAPHGKQWRLACRDLGIADEQRCHALPFPTQQRARRFLYRCPKCEKDFPRVRQIRRATACLACCRKHSHGQYDEQFRLQLIRHRTAQRH
jgi:SprT protein